MPSMKMKSIAWSLLALNLTVTGIHGQEPYNLETELEQGRIKVLNRDIKVYGEAAGAVEMNAARGDGLAVLEGIGWSRGTIQLELLGENSPGRSFIGFAFNIVDQETYEAVYFRPFNFVADEQERKDHMVQYICHPDYTWSRLREERTGEFENEIPAPPDPDGWFRVKIRVEENRVEVYVEDRAEPVLAVERLTRSESNAIGLWTGNGSSGRYRNLVVE